MCRLFGLWDQSCLKYQLLPNFKVLFRNCEGQGETVWIGHKRGEVLKNKIKAFHRVQTPGNRIICAQMMWRQKLKAAISIILNWWSSGHNFFHSFKSNQIRKQFLFSDTWLRCLWIRNIFVSKSQYLDKNRRSTHFLFSEFAAEGGRQIYGASRPLRFSIHLNCWTWTLVVGRFWDFQEGNLPPQVFFIAATFFTLGHFWSSVPSCLSIIIELNHTYLKRFKRDHGLLCTSN